MEEAAQAESVNFLSQRLAKMPSPLMSKRIRSSGSGHPESADPMEDGDGDLEEAQGIWEHRDRTNVTNQFAQVSIVGQGPPPHTSTSGHDVFLAPSWQPWPSQVRNESRRWGQFQGVSSNVEKAESAAACGGYPTFLRPPRSASPSMIQELIGFPRV